MKDKISININKKNKKLRILKHSDNYLDDRLVFIAIIGNIYNLEKKKLKLHEVKELYYKYKTKINNYLDGIYSIIVYDYKEEKVYVFQDYFGSNHQIYYYDSEEKIYISNELKEIILHNNINWELNNKSVKNIINKGYISDNKTLVKDIYKVESKKHLEIDLKKYKIYEQKEKLIINNKYENITKDIYNDEVAEIIKSITKNTNNISTTLSSGYDSNYILYTLNKIYKKKIDTFSVGGKTGKSEIESAKKISNYYDNVNFNYEYVDGDTLNNYPEIVWILEGSLYENGIFLQYELSKMINKKKKDNIILGECADQTLRYEMYHKNYLLYRRTRNRISSIVKKIIHKPIYQMIIADPYEFASSLIIKKNGMMMNYFNINTNYPYTRKSFLELGLKTAKKKDIKKKYHKEVIKYFLPKKITKNLNKIGGSTELKPLFTGDIKFNEIKEYCKNSKYYKVKKFKNNEQEKEYYLKILYIELFNKIFLENEIQKITNSNFKKYKLKYFLDK